MTTGRGLRIAAVVAGGVLAAIVAVRRVSPSGPRVTVVRAEFGALKAWVMTNGIVEPVISDVARAHVPTYVTQVLVTEGQLVEPGDLLVTLDVGAQQAELTQQREALTRADNQLKALETIGQSGELAQVVAQLGSAEADRAHLTQQRAGTARLIEKQAATREELDQIDLAIDPRQGHARDPDPEKGEPGTQRRNGRERRHPGCAAGTRPAAGLRGSRQVRTGPRLRPRYSLRTAGTSWHASR